MHYRGAFAPARDETILMHHRLPLVLRFARANRIDQCTMGDESARFGLVSAGKAYQDTRQALSYLGIDDARARTLGLALYKVGMVWPLEPLGLKEFAAGRPELFFIEEKAAFVERQAAAVLYNETARPRIVGKFDEHRAPLVTLRSNSNRWTSRWRSPPGFARRAWPMQRWRRAWRLRPLAAAASSIGRRQDSRPPYFCSGCPHNTSTNVPEGSFALAGIGCHSMAMFYKPRTLLSTQMGGEGTNWSGPAPFQQDPPRLPEPGDGTYFHSGLLAHPGRGRQQCKHHLQDPLQRRRGHDRWPAGGRADLCQRVARQVLREGVKRVVLVSEQPGSHRSDAALPKEVTILHRDSLDEVQRELRDVAGCTVLIYEQTCAAEKRRTAQAKGDWTIRPNGSFINRPFARAVATARRNPGASARARGNRNWAASATSTSRRATRTTLREGLLPVVRHVSCGRLRQPATTAIHDELLRSLPVAAGVAHHRIQFHVMITGIGGTG